MSVVILGAGVTGLAAGVASGAPVFEAVETPGGICSSYYVRAEDHDAHSAREGLQFESDRICERR